MLKTTTKNVICFTKGFVIFNKGEKDNKLYAYTVQSNLMHLGYILDSDAFTALRMAKEEDIVKFNEEVVEHYTSLLGGGKNYLPLYGDFPLSMANDDDVSAIDTACLHFVSNNTMEGLALPKEKSYISEKVKYQVIELGTEETLDEVFRSIVSVNQSITGWDIEVMEWFAQSGRDLKFPPVIPFKENLCRLVAWGIDAPVQTATDVLRVACYLSGGDITLTNVTKFKNFKRSERRNLLTLLEKSSCDPTEMVTRSEQWVRLGEKLHPMEYLKSHPRAAMAFTMMRKGLKGGKTIKVKSFNSQVNSEFAKGLQEGVNILGKRPGEFMRRIDWLLRTYTNPADLGIILNKLSVCAMGCTNKVMYELYNHLEVRNEKCNNRSIMIKGARKRTKLPSLPHIDQSILDVVKSSVLDTISRKFSRLDPLGKVYIDEKLSLIPLPTNMRSLDLSAAPIIRGQRIPIATPDAKVLRAFFHWEDKDGTLDPDLSAMFIHDDGKTNIVTYSSLSYGSSVHSGDVIARKGNCAEYIDIDIKDAISKGCKYVSVDVRNFRGGSLAVMNGVFGIMEREFPESNKTWLPATVSMATKCNSAAQTTILSVIDLEKMEYIFLDIDSSGAALASNKKNVVDAIMDYIKIPALNVHKLLSLHAEARGSIVTNPEDADVKFLYEDFSKDYIKTGQYMGI